MRVDTVGCQLARVSEPHLEFLEAAFLLDGDPVGDRVSQCMWVDVPAINLLELLCVEFDLGGLSSTTDIDAVAVA